MPVLQDTVEITLVSSVISYYENKGYNIPRSLDNRGRMKVKEGTKLLVKLADLPEGSGVNVLVKCDSCGKEYPLPWRDVHEHDGKIYCKKHSGILRSGENAYNWNSEKSQSEREEERDNIEYNNFIRRVLKRDDYMCKICGSASEICVHHLDGYNWCYEKRTKDSNGITLCKEHHDQFHAIYGKGNNTKEQFEEWIGSPIGELSEGILPPAKKVICMDDDQVFNSVYEAARYYKFDKNLFYNVLNKKYRAVYKKHHFLWYDDYLDMDKDGVSNYWRWVLGVKKQS